MRNITQLKYGETSTIKSVDENSSYLLELGFIPGELIKVVAKSPFKGPISLRIKGTTIALRFDEALQVTC